MKKIITTTLAAGLAASVMAGTDVTLDVASAYVFRGMTFNDEAVFQPGIEASELGIPEAYGSVAVGAWANYDIGDYGGALESSEFSEIDWYVSYSLPSLVDGLDIFVGYCEYTYPMAVDIDDTTMLPTGEPVGADKEANIGLGYEVAGIGLGATAYFPIGGGGADWVYYEFAAEYGFDLSEELSASVGASAAYLTLDDSAADDGFHDGSLSAAVSYALSDVWSVGLSGTYIAQLDDEVLVDVDDGGLYDVEFVGMFSLAASF